METTYHHYPNLYHKQAFLKRQIYIHHTVSNANPYNVAEWWQRRYKETGQRIATAYIIAGAPTNFDAPYQDGEILQIFPEEYFAAHLGKVSETPGTDPLPPVTLHRHSIAIELCNWGYVKKGTAANFFSATGEILKPDKVIDLDYRNQQYYHRYTDAQIESLRQLLLYLTKKYNIPRTYYPMFGICPEALHGQPGIFSHTSVRKDKTDCSPQPKLITMLKSLAE